jgi:hypothetical protein
MSLVLANPLLKLWSIALNPAKNGTWIDLNATILHHLSQIAVADAVLAVPAHAQQDDPNWEAAALEHRQQGGSSTGRPS